MQTPSTEPSAESGMPSPSESGFHHGHATRGLRHPEWRARRRAHVARRVAHHDLLVTDLMCFLLRTGFRLAEVAARSSGEIKYLTRANLTAVVKGVPYVDPSPEVLRSMSAGDYFLVTPPRSKTDEWGEIHCPFPCTLMYSDDPLNPARRLRDAELRAPCRGEARTTTPLFARPGGVLLTHSYMDPILSSVLTYTIGREDAAKYSWHSFRIGLACALRAAGCPPDPMGWRAADLTAVGCAPNRSASTR